jgi:hypothetical protein
MDVTAQTKAAAFAHVQLWHGSKSHLVTGYNSTDPEVIERQILEMQEMGFVGANLNWRGPQNEFETKAAIRWMTACERLGFVFFLCPDEGIFRDATNKQAAMEEAMLFLRRVFFPSTAYWVRNGQPIVNFFLYNDGLNWTPIRAILGNALLLFQNKSGLTHAESNGCFAWINPDSKLSTGAWDGSIGLKYLKDYYAATATSDKLVLGGAWPGFDDTHPTDPTRNVWGTGVPRIMPRYNGGTLAVTFGMVPDKVPVVLVSTWNDWEEGSNIETL